MTALITFALGKFRGRNEVELFFELRDESGEVLGEFAPHDVRQSISMMTEREHGVFRQHSLVAVQNNDPISGVSQLTSSTAALALRMSSGNPLISPTSFGGINTWTPSVALIW